MVADNGNEQHTDALQLSQELDYLETQLEKARRKVQSWTARLQMLEESVSRTRQELERLT